MGLEALPIEVEVDVASRGLPSLSIVGLPDKAVQESKERVRAALHNSGVVVPPKKITVNLAPADLPKQGPAYDLPIALGLVFASGDIEPVALDKSVFVGELSLDGSLRHTVGTLPMAIMAKKHGLKQVYVPEANAREAAIVAGIKVYPVRSVTQLVAHLTEIKTIEPIETVDVDELLTHATVPIDMADVHGQEYAKRALEIAAAGGHNVFMQGVPGAGKTMLARAFAGILPRLTKEEALEVTKIYSIANELPRSQPVIATRPLRQPHHTVSRVGMIGGGSVPKPGEVSLAHRGVLFLDEFPEFPRSVLESLRGPMEDGVVHITRAAQSNSYPCRFSLLAAANPCPCGHYGSKKHACQCSASQISRYQKKVSGPILDRIDLHVTVGAVEIETLAKKHSGAERSDQIRKRVQQARERQQKRYRKLKIVSNAELSTKQVKRYCPIADEDRQFLSRATDKLGLTARSYFKTIRTARTIADLSGTGEIKREHLAEALQYRPTQALLG